MNAASRSPHLLAAARVLAAVALPYGADGMAAVQAARQAARSRFGTDREDALWLGCLLARLPRPRRWRAPVAAETPIEFEALPALAAPGWTRQPGARPLILAALALLRRDEQVAYLMHGLGGWPAARIAALTGATVFGAERQLRSARHALHAMLQLKGVCDADGYPSLDAAVAAVLADAYAGEGAAGDVGAADAPRRLRARLWLARGHLRRAAGVVVLVGVAAAFWPALPELGHDAASDAAMLSSEWPLEMLLQPLEEGAR
ncbi:hypothetical protein [Crenobacter caeni]|uniref:RNA polymerase sigma factor 70 region 4 type 2 domain-containing protein n=1 Tax=Crenobacter caeni TaxID=2705474 RepID=A0A6B2KTX3_9NEIS|nr:hypothetical protein [Crenobacter caeni]NDV13598.1 hypothetical protein [Crenobacter caeni]